MREIKFRVWIKRYNKIFTLESLKWSDDKLIISANTPNGGLHNVWFDADELDNLSNVIHLMQYTGLFDKNGTPIYEGDILKIGNSNIEVIWDKNNACFTLKSNHFHLGFQSIFYEVIGNIYEHPNLLESEEK
jgi:uncharacterized phage protein (TIGR01671 family)